MPGMHKLDDQNEQENRKRGKKWGFFILLSVVLGAATLSLLGLFMDGNKIFASLSRLPLLIFVVPFLSYFASYFVDALRLKLLVRPSGNRLPFWACLNNTIMGQFISNITPLSAGGQPFQVYHLKKIGLPLKTAGNVIVSRFAVNSLVMLLILLVSTPFIISIGAELGGLRYFYYTGLGVTVSLSLALFAVLLKPGLLLGLVFNLKKSFMNAGLAKVLKNPGWHKRPIRALFEFRRELRTLWKEGLPTLLADALLSCLVNVFLALALWYPLEELYGETVSFPMVFMSFIIIWQVAFYVPSPGSSGGLEALFTVVFSNILGFPESSLVAVLVWRFSTYYLHLIPGVLVSASLLGFWSKKGRKPQAV